LQTTSLSQEGGACSGTPPSLPPRCSDRAWKLRKTFSTRITAESTILPTTICLDPSSVWTGRRREGGFAPWDYRWPLTRSTQRQSRGLRVAARELKDRRPSAFDAVKDSCMTPKPKRNNAPVTSGLGTRQRSHCGGAQRGQAELCTWTVGTIERPGSTMEAYRNGNAIEDLLRHKHIAWERRR
jgi:hypothetical protein